MGFGLGGRRCGALMLLCVLPLSAVSADAAIYRWVDAQGRVHYGDATTAPRSAEAVPRRGADAPAGAASAVDPTELPVAELPPTEQSCEQAQAQYDAYRGADQIVETDSLGVERTMDGAQREQLLARAEMRVSRACGDAAVTP